jgi:hypothetical protein
MPLSLISTRENISGCDLDRAHRGCSERRTAQLILNRRLGVDRLCADQVGVPEASVYGHRFGHLHHTDALEWVSEWHVGGEAGRRCAVEYSVKAAPSRIQVREKLRVSWKKGNKRDRSRSQSSGAAGSNGRWWTGSGKRHQVAASAHAEAACMLSLDVFRFDLARRTLSSRILRLRVLAGATVSDRADPQPNVRRPEEGRIRSVAGRGGCRK